MADKDFDEFVRNSKIGFLQDFRPSSHLELQVCTEPVEETEITGPELRVTATAELNSNVINTINFTLVEPRRGSKTLATGIRLNGSDITIWFKEARFYLYKAQSSP